MLSNVILSTQKLISSISTAHGSQFINGQSKKKKKAKLSDTISVAIIVSAYLRRYKY